MDYREILFSSDGRTATITFNRPAKLNAFTFRMLEEVLDALCTRLGQARALVLRGAGRAFSAGDDLTGMGGTDHRVDIPRCHHAVVKRLRELRIPVVAAIHGYALGAAFDLILACDFRLAAETAQLGDVRVRRAMNAMSGASFWLPRYTGLGRASEILMLGDRFTARQALEWGLVTRVFPDAEFEAGVEKFLRQLTELPTRAIGANKALITAAMRDAFEGALARELEELLEIYKTDDFREAIRSFIDKREPRYRGE